MFTIHTFETRQYTKISSYCSGCCECVYSLVLAAVVTVGFQATSLEVPEEESSTSMVGTSFDVCVEVLSGVLERPVEVLLSLEDGTAIGVCVCVCVCV